MRILSFDTSTERLQVSLLQDGRAVCQRSLEPEYKEAETPNSDTPKSDVLTSEMLVSGGQASELRSTETSKSEAPKSQAVSETGAASRPLPRGRMSRDPKKGAPRQESSSFLLPMIDEAMVEAAWDKRSIDCIVIGVGPGGFTAIRTGVVTARTLAQALDIALVPISLLEVYATECSLPSAVVLKAGKEHFFAAAYDRGPAIAEFGDKSVAECIEPAYLTAAELSTQLASIQRWTVPLDFNRDTISGTHEFAELPKIENIATRQGQIAWNRLSLTMSLPPDDRRVGENAEHNELRAKLLQAFPYRSVQPLYLRNPSITLKATNNPTTNAH